MGPYGETAWIYRNAGWGGVLPLPPGAKTPPPGGYTGWAGVEPSGADVQAWVDGPQADGNIGLRLPSGLYGLDVDDYGAKTGGTALGRAVERLGPLPATWIVSSREESTSGIRLFRADLPPGRRWKDEPAGHGAGIEAIHFGHRYAVAWPSTHPETGRKYQWRRPDGIAAADGEIPSPSDLPWLSPEWVEALTEPGEIRSGDMAGHEETVARVSTWRDGVPCPRVTVAAERAMGALAAGAAGAALHPAIVGGTFELASLGHEGHRGARRALAEHYAAAVQVRAGRVGADRGTAEAEWWRAVRGAIGKLPAASAREICDCDLWAGDGLLFDPPPEYLARLAETQGAAALDSASVNFDEAPAPEQGDAWANAVRAEALRVRLRDEAAELHRAEKHARTWAAPVSHGDLAQELLLPDTDPEWRIHGLLGTGHNAVLIAARKAGKTTMVNEFVRSYVDGGMFLGTQEVITPPGGIAVFNYEVDERQYRRWLRSVGVHNTHLVHVLHLRGRTLPLVNDRVQAWVTAWLAERGVSAWVLDPYSRAYIGSIQNGNDEAQVSTFLDVLDVIKSDAGVSELVMPVHTPKARVEDGNETAIGSGRLEGWPDVMWYLTRDGKTRYIRAEGRDIELDETELHFDEATRRLRIEVFGQDRKTSRQNKNVDRLVAYVHENPECTQNTIMTALGWNAAKVREAVGASGGRVVTEPGPNRSTIHILKEDISGVTKKESHTPSHRVTPESVGGVTLPVRESPPPLAGVVNVDEVIPTPLEPFNPFDLGDVA